MSSCPVNKNKLIGNVQSCRQNGQTLILIMLVLLIMLMVCLFLVDIQHIIKLKAKTVSAVDSAALVGAEWQRHTLNMIGEINLIKGTTVLITDFTDDTANDSYAAIPDTEEYTADTTEAKENREQYYTNTILPQITRFKAAMLNLTEMQVRLSFVGPMLGLGALQQAAKNNGLTRSAGCCSTGLKHYNDLLEANKYTTLTSQTIAGTSFYWREPYAAMLYQVLQVDNSYAYGFAVDPHPNYLNYPEIDGYDFLTDEGLYSAINSKSWCYYTLRQILRSGLADNWWQNISVVMDSMQFPGESEYLTVGISFSAFSEAAYYSDTAAEGVLAQEDAFSSLFTARSLTALASSDEDTSSLFTDKADPYTSTSDMSTANKDADDEDWKFHDKIMGSIVWAVYDSSWADYDDEVITNWGNWLRGGFQDGYTYAGCISYIKTNRTPSTITSHWKKFDDSGSLDDSQTDKSYLGDDLSWADNVNSEDYSSALKQAEIKLEQGPDTLTTDSAAKPFGRLSSGGTYYTPNTISVILPVFTHSALIPVSLEYPNGADMDDDDSFMIFLTEYLPALAESGGFDDMLEWMDSNGYTEKLLKYHNALVSLSDPDWRQEGIDWLDTPVDEDDPDGETNEDLCTSWPSGSGGGRSGPSILH